MNLDNDYDEDGNNIVPCPICLNVHCPSKEGGKCPEEDDYVKGMTLQQKFNEYIASGDPIISISDEQRDWILPFIERCVGEGKVFAFQPQWTDEEPAWLCILTKGNEVLAEKVYKKSELGNAYWKETGNYASSVITVEETNIGAKRLLQTLTQEDKIK